MRERRLVLDVPGGQVQHDWDSVTDEYWDRAFCEVGSAIVEGHDDRVTLGHGTVAKHLEGTVECRGPPLVGNQRHLVLETRWREIDLDRRPPPDPVVLEQNDTAGWRHDAVGGRS